MVRQQFLTGITPVRLTCLLLQHRKDAKHIKEILRLYKVGIISSLFKWLDNIRYERKIQKTEISDDPIFIIGHWRSGTTFLQKLLSQDKQFTTPSFFECAFPDAFISAEKCIKPRLGKNLPTTRIFDNMPFGTDEPFDDEFAILKMGGESIMLDFVFPERLSRRKGEHFQQGDTDHWAKVFLYFAKKLSFHRRGRLLFKSPVNTVRIRKILEIFPKAKFIYLSRSVQDVYISSVHQAEKLLEHNQLSSTDVDTRDYLTRRFHFLKNKYNNEKQSIPDSQLVEVSYESLVESPIKTINEIYRQLNLPGIEHARANFSSYIESMAGYQKNKYTITDAELSYIKSAWVTN